MTSPPTRRWSSEDAALAAVSSAPGALATPRALLTDALLSATESVRRLVELTVEEMDRMVTRARSLRGPSRTAPRPAEPAVDAG
ncbi:hypothetical protein SAMN05660657_03515 [Geodermatophilus amargosae]|uniref:Uncharacterized protein n=1 Tax=Geodermatophilus amargosae TaxID=1296565 RepID=A0A1I7BDD3_9ACTN|nr:hypothetical protein [Geodermatophilus amargosae]SFT85206.1 hypothetical protein SAMN05660657_03515 [Geodermatophilus amargosae]